MNNISIYNDLEFAVPGQIMEYLICNDTNVSMWEIPLSRISIRHESENLCVYIDDKPVDLKCLYNIPDHRMDEFMSNLCDNILSSLWVKVRIGEYENILHCCLAPGDRETSNKYLNIAGQYKNIIRQVFGMYANVFKLKDRTDLLNRLGYVTLSYDPWVDNIIKGLGTNVGKSIGEFQYAYLSTLPFPTMHLESLGIE